MANEQLNVLPPDYELHWYRIERVLGQGGFGITYLARDTNLDQLVAIKEYLPVEFAARAANDSAQPRSEDHEERYRWGLARFISEAQTLAKFDHPSIVQVNSVFEYNNTAYIVMRYERGENLQSVLNRRKTLEESELMDILPPILDGLEQVHRCGFIHRDIKPDNIYIRQDGTPVLLDFGSARQALGNDRALTVVVAPGYAPFEQYCNSVDQQGPWTDIYGLGATVYRAIVGDPPIDAMARSKGLLGSARDILVLATDIGRGRYSQKFLEAIDHALAFNERDRPQTIAEWRLELCARIDLASGEDETLTVKRESLMPSPPKHDARGDAQTAEPPRRDTAKPYEADVLTDGPERKQRSGQPRPVYSLWARAGVVVAFIVLLSLLGIFVVREMQDQPELDQSAALLRQQAPIEEPPLDQKLSAIQQQEFEDREEKLRERERQQDEERKRIEEEKRRLEDELRKAEEERQKARAAKEEVRRVAEAARKRAERLSRLVAAAETNLAGDQLSNALDQSRKALKLEPENTKATQVIERIVARYIVLADQMMGSGEFDKAQGYLDTAAAIGLAAEKVASAHTRLAREKKMFKEAQRQQAQEANRVAAVAPRDAITSPPSIGEELARAIATFKRGDYKDALGKLRPLAENHDILEAKYYVGLMYGTGKGVPRDDAEAVKWYRRAAEQGYDPAQNSLGVMYTKGRGVARDDGAALEWYRRAAKQCNADAQTNIGNMYAQGRGVAQNDFQAYAWYQVAAAAGSEIAKEQRDAIAKKLQSVELEHARKLAQRYAQCKKAED